MARERNTDDISLAGRSIADLPPLLTPAELAALLRTSRKAIYAAVERGLVPGVVRRGTRLLFDRERIRRWLDQGRVPEPRRTP